MKKNPRLVLYDNTLDFIYDHVMRQMPGYEKFIIANIILLDDKFNLMLCNIATIYAVWYTSGGGT